MTHLKNNQIFNIQGRIDTSMTKTEIKDVKVYLKERFIQVSACGRVKHSSHDHLIYESMKKIPKGGSEDFKAEVAVPPNIFSYTAIGNIFSRAIFLTLEAEVFCCYSNPKIELHTILLSDLEP